MQILISKNAKIKEKTKVRWTDQKTLRHIYKTHLEKQRKLLQKNNALWTSEIRLAWLKINITYIFL